MKRIFIIMMCCVCCIAALTGCDTDFEPREEPVLYKETIEVTVTDVYQRRWYAANAHHFELTLTVYNEEYGITDKVTETGAGMWGQPKHWDATKGDKLTAVLYTWKMVSTGQIIRREIHHFE